MSSATGPRAGRRPGASGTKEGIAAAARHRFGELGYDRTTIRGIAQDAAVDPALVLHFFGSKQALFRTVIALPFEPEVVIPEVLRGARSEMGLRLARFAVGVFEDPERRDVMVGVVRAATAEPATAAMVREMATQRIVDAIAGALDSPDGMLRAELVASQIIGMAIARYILRFEPLASLPPERLIEAVAPNLQRYLTRPL